MEQFSNNRVIKNNSIPKIRQFSLLAKKDIDKIFLLGFSLTFKVFFQFSLTFPSFP